MTLGEIYKKYPNHYIAIDNIKLVNDQIYVDVIHAVGNLTRDAMEKVYQDMAVARDKGEFQAIHQTYTTTSNQFEIGGFQTDISDLLKALREMDE